MTTCVVEFTVLIPEFPGGCGGKGWNVRKRKREGERGGGVYGLAFFGKKGKERKKKEKEKEKTRVTHIN